MINGVQVGSTASETPPGVFSFSDPHEVFLFFFFKLSGIINVFALVLECCLRCLHSAAALILQLQPAAAPVELLYI